VFAVMRHLLQHLIRRSSSGLAYGVLSKEAADARMASDEGMSSASKRVATLPLDRARSKLPAMWSFANPTVFLALTRRLLPWLALVTAVLFSVGLYMSFAAPPDYQQGETVKIMYVHVPTAWLSTFIYGVMALASLGTLVWRHPLADAAQKAAAPLGAGFTFICLVTGSLWGKPMWGTYWVWDARLTSVLVLFILYLGLIALWRSIDDPGRAARAAAILTLVGAVDLPIIKFSVEWWNTLHQPASVFRMDGPTIAPELLLPLLVMAVAFTLLFLTLHLMAIRNEILRRRVARLTMIAAAEGDPLSPFLTPRVARS
jgi:heme exporter protein C